MKKYLLIAEKPSLMNALKNVFIAHKDEFDFSVTFTCQVGHLVKLVKPEQYNEEFKKWEWENLPINPEKLGGWKYTPIPEAKDVLNVIKKELSENKYDGIISAGDPDEQGCLLINLVLEHLHNHLPVLRYWQNDPTESKVLEGFHNLRDNDHDPFLINLGKSGLAKQHSDWLLGINGSRAATVKSHNRVACGRVKSMILKVVVDRENEIKNFVPHTTYEMDCIFSKKGTLKGTLLEDGPDSSKRRFETEDDCKIIYDNINKESSVFSVTKKKEKTTAPELFKLATLQIEASKYGFNSDEVSKTAQSLYEKKILSYPRTTCQYIGSTFNLEEMISAALVFPEYEAYKNYITADTIALVKSNKKYVNDKALSESGHYALTPTSLHADIDSLSEKETIILKLVYKQFLNIFLPPLIQDKTTIIIKTVDNNYFKAMGKIVIDPGYTALNKIDLKENELPDLKEGDLLEIDGMEASPKTTKCPSRFNDGTLIEMLENPSKYLSDINNKQIIKECEGIGTPATRSEIIKQLINVDKYLVRKKEKGKSEFIFPTDTGTWIIEQFGTLSFFQVDLTAEWEKKLNLIRKGELEPSEYNDEMNQYIDDIINEIKNLNIKKLEQNNEIATCSCGGKILEGKTKYYCSNWRDGCKFVIWKNSYGSDFTKTDVKNLLSGKKITKKCTNKDNETYNQEFVFEENELRKAVKEFSIIKSICPKCGGQLKLYETSLICSNIESKKCDFGLPRNICGATIDLEDYENLLKGKIISKKMKKTGKPSWMQDLRLSTDFTLSFIEKNPTDIQKCPICRKHNVKDFGFAYKCDAYSTKECTLYIPRKFESKAFSSTSEILMDDVKQLLSGKTIERSIKWTKSGKKSKNNIKLNAKGQLEIIFNQ